MKRGGFVLDAEGGAGAGVGHPAGAGGDHLAEVLGIAPGPVGVDEGSGAQVADAAAATAQQPRLHRVVDGSDEPLLDGAEWYEDALAAADHMLLFRNGMRQALRRGEIGEATPGDRGDKPKGPALADHPFADAPGWAEDAYVGGITGLFGTVVEGLGKVGKGLSDGLGKANAIATIGKFVEPRTLTRIAGEEKNAGDRVGADVRAARLLQLVG